MAQAAIDRHCHPMLFAGAIEIPTELIIAILAGLLLAALLVISTGGLLAWMICRERKAFWLGSLAFLLVVALLARQSVDLEASVMGGYAASALVGFVARRVASQPR